MLQQLYLQGCARTRTGQVKPGISNPDRNFEPGPEKGNTRTGAGRVTQDPDRFQLPGPEKK